LLPVRLLERVSVGVAAGGPQERVVFEDVQRPAASGGGASSRSGQPRQATPNVAVPLGEWVCRLGRGRSQVRGGGALALERRYPEDFRCQLPEREYGIGDVRRVLYRLPMVSAAVSAGETV